MSLLFFAPCFGFVFHEALRFFPYADGSRAFEIASWKRYLVTSIVLVCLSLAFSELFALTTAAERLMIGFSITSGVGIIKGARVEEVGSDDHFQQDVDGEKEEEPESQTSFKDTVRKSLDEFYWYR